MTFQNYLDDSFLDAALILAEGWRAGTFGFMTFGTVGFSGIFFLDALASAKSNYNMFIGVEKFQKIVILI